MTPNYAMEQVTLQNQQQQEEKEKVHPEEIIEQSHKRHFFRKNPIKKIEITKSVFRHR